MTTATDDTTDVTETAERLADARGAEARVSHRTWVEFAMATHRGCCPDDPTQRTGPAWDWVDRVGDGLLQIRGAWGDGQCGRCGRLGMGWVRTGARDLADSEDSEATMVAMLDELEQEWAAWAEEMHRTILAKLRSSLGEALARLAAGEDEDDVRTGGDMYPGVWRNYAGEWEAWDYDPRDRPTGDMLTATISVTSDISQ